MESQIRHRHGLGLGMWTGADIDDALPVFEGRFPAWRDVMFEFETREPHNRFLMFDLRRIVEQLEEDGWSCVPRADEVRDGLWSGYVYVRKGTKEFAAAGFVTADGSKGMVEGTLFGRDDRELHDAITAIIGLLGEKFKVPVEVREPIEPLPWRA